MKGRIPLNGRRISKNFVFFFFILVKCICTTNSAIIPESNSEKWICTDRHHGDLIPHPEDCHSYFVCDQNQPKLVTCNGNLHYDRRQKVCNWPEAANCILGEYPPYWDSSTSSKPESTKISSPASTTSVIPKTTASSHSESKTTQNPKSTTIRLDTSSTKVEKTTTVTSTTQCNTQPSFVTTVKPKNSTIGSTDEDGKIVDPMKNYDPKKVQCLYSGVYFLPHPGKCQKYFICANHVLYLHSCGIKSNWNYETERCDYEKYAQCYIDESNTSKSTTKRKRSTPPIKTTTTAETTTEKVLEIKCPLDRQKFIAHPTDCNKYYICIHGKPALTNCPATLWWDEDKEVCGYPENSYCKAAYE